MKKNRLDYLVIIVAATVPFLISYSGNEKMLSTFSFIIFMTAYLLGKAVAKHEIKKQSSNPIEGNIR